MRNIMLGLIIFLYGNVFGQASLDSGLVVYYPFNGNANDAGLNHNNGTIYKAEICDDKDDHTESAYYFNSSKFAYISNMTDKDLPADSSSRTLSAWIKAYDSGNNGMVILDYGRMANNMDCSLCYIKESVVVAFWANDVSGKINVNDNQWHHIVGLWDGTNVAIYIDKQLDVLKPLALKPNTTLNGSLTIGVTNNKLWHHFHGMIDEVRIYNRALSEEEISLLYNKELTIVQNEYKSKLIADSNQLLPCYPNPFNNQTIIAYSISTSNFVTLNIYDILGRNIKTLVSEFQDSGNYNIHFDANSLASGIYYYELQAGNDYRKINKMLLIR